MAVIPGSNSRVVADAKDLNPRSVRLFRYTAHTLTIASRQADFAEWRSRTEVNVQSLFTMKLIGIVTVSYTHLDVYKRQRH